MRYKIVYLFYLHTNKHKWIVVNKWTYVLKRCTAYEKICLNEEVLELKFNLLPVKKVKLLIAFKMSSIYSLCESDGLTEMIKKWREMIIRSIIKVKMGQS